VALEALGLESENKLNSMDVNEEALVDAREDPGRPVTAGDVVDELGIARRTAHNKLGGSSSAASWRHARSARATRQPLPAERGSTLTNTLERPRSTVG